jgi:hypothetical protein
MGGGSGLQAREQRIKAEMAQTVKNIEDLQFQRDEMQARREETAEDRALRLMLEQMGIASAEKRSAAEIAARSGELGKELDFRRDELAQRGAEGEAERENRLAVVQMQIDEAVARAETAAGADITEAQMQALIEARKAMAGDRVLESRLMNIERTYKNNPVEMDVQKQLAVEEYLDDYLAPFGLSSGSSFEVTKPAQR